MILLEPDKYGLVAQKLMDVKINNLFAMSVVEHHVDGKVYVDDDVNPSAFYIVHPYGMSLCFGNVSDAFLQNRLNDYLVGRNGLRQAAEFLQVFPKENESKIDETLGKNLFIHETGKATDYPKTSVVKYTHVNFQFNRQKFDELVSEIDLTKHHFRLIDSSVYNETNGRVVPKKKFGIVLMILSKMG